MKTCLRRMARCQAIPLVLAITWLPYIATRCVENPFTHGGCGMLAPAHGHSEGHDPRATSHDGVTARHQHHDDQRSPARTCCDLTGECNIKITRGAPSLDPVQLLATLPVAVDASVPHAELSHYRGAPALAHAPPTYLRNATLLI